MRRKRPPANASHRLQDRGKRLIDRIFRHLPCVVCLSLGRKGEAIYRTVPCHILNKGMYGHLRLVAMNLLPCCSEHHTNGTQISMHAPAGDTKVVMRFYKWMKENLPLHYRWYLNNRDDRAPHRLTLGDYEEICSHLQSLADRPQEAERLIYER